MPKQLTNPRQTIVQLYLLFVVSSLSVANFGCTKDPASSSVAAVTAAADTKPVGELVDTPDYLRWERFPVDTKVVRNRKIVSSEGTVEVITMLTLREKTDKKISVDQQVTVIRPESTLENEPQSLEYVAKFHLPAGMNIESFTLPSLKAKQIGTEEIEVLGRTYKADVFEWVEQNERGPMNVKLWRSDEMPGSTVKEESVVKNGSDHHLEVVTEINIPEEK